MSSEPENLNSLKIPSDIQPDEPQTDYSVTSERIEVIFKNLRDVLCTKIAEADAVVGCVAWMTDPIILDDLALKDAVAIVVQKEDFLRPDSEPAFGWKHRLRARYKTLSEGPNRYDETWRKSPLYMMSTCGDPTVDAVRCMGNHNSNKSVTRPRMHHKFLVFMRKRAVDGEQTYFPYAVWTGSFNFTENGGNSLENAVFITDAKIAHAFLLEAGQILALSEPLDWESEWCAPEWRIGT